MLGHADVVGQGRSPELPKINVNNLVGLCAQGLCHLYGAVQFHTVALAVPETQAVYLIALDLAMAMAVVESMPPLDSTTAFGVWFINASFF